jgi:hypothetical protein
VKIYQVHFSFELSSAVYPTLAQAKSELIKILEEEMEGIKSRHLLFGDRFRMKHEVLTAEIELCEVVKITPESLCAILNTNGGSWVVSHKPIGKITLDSNKKKPRMVRSDGVINQN